MRWYRPGDVVRGEFTTADPLTGAAADADATPTLAVARNGAADGSVTVTVTNPEAGRYGYSFTVPAGWSAGDHVAVRAAAAVGGVAGRATPLEARLVGTDLAADLPAATAAALLATSLDGVSLLTYLRTDQAAFVGRRAEGPPNTWTYYAPDGVTPRLVAVFDAAGVLLSVTRV